MLPGLKYSAAAITVLFGACLVLPVEDDFPVAGDDVVVDVLSTRGDDVGGVVRLKTVATTMTENKRRGWNVRNVGLDVYTGSGD